MWKPNKFKEYISKLRTREESVFFYSIFVILLIFTMPRLISYFSPTGDTLDTSWCWMLGYGLQHHLQWGQSIIWTYGPLGFLENPYFYSNHILWSIAALVRFISWFSFSLGFAIILLRLCPGAKAFTRFALPIVIAWLVGNSLLEIAAQSAFISILLLILALGDKNKKIIISSLLTAGIFLAFSSLIKSTSLIIAVFILFIYPILFQYTKPQKQNLFLSLLPLISFLATFGILWTLTGQAIAHIPLYLQGIWAIASGYTPAMSIKGKSPQTAVALFILILFTIVIIKLLIKKERTLLAQSLILSVMVFWAWKEGFTRHDSSFVGGHAMFFFGVVLLFGAVEIVLLSEKSLKGYIMIVYILALLFALPGARVFNTNELDSNYKNFIHLITSKTYREIQQHKETIAIANQFQLDPVLLSVVKNHSVNIIPWNLMMAQGYNMDLVTSPIIQAYSVYTPYLDHLNAKQIWEGKSADKVIYSFESIDGRYPIFDEPATFRALLTCYRMEYSSSPYAVLSSSKCIKPELTKISEPIKNMFNTWVIVPTQANYVNVNVRTTLVGHLTNILWKSDQIHILFKLSDGSIKDPYRFIYPVGSDGLFVKYFIESQYQANQLFAGDKSGLQRINAFKLVTTPNSIDYDNEITSQFFSLIHATSTHD